MWTVDTNRQSPRSQTQTCISKISDLLRSQIYLTSPITMMRSRRNKRNSWASTFVRAAGTATVIYGGCRLASWAWGRLSNSNDEDYDEENTESNKEQITRGIMLGEMKPNISQWNGDAPIEIQARSFHLEKCHREAANAMSDFLATLKKSIEYNTDCSDEKKELKKIRIKKRNIRQQEAQNSNVSESGSYDRQQHVSSSIDGLEKREKALWETIKIQSLTKFLAAVYAHNVLFLALVSQIHILGGRNTIEEDNDTEDINVIDNIDKERRKHLAVHEVVLKETYQYFFEKGIPLLCGTLQSVIKNSNISQWDMTNVDTMEISLVDFMKALQSIRDTMETEISSEKEVPRLILSSIIQPSSINYTQDEQQDEVGDTYNSCTANAEAKFILNQTWDILESPVFDKALKDSIQISFQRVKENYWESYWGHQLEFQQEESKVVGEESNTVTLPLVQIITLLKNPFNSFFSNDTAIENKTSQASIKIKGHDDPFLLPQNNDLIRYPNRYLSELESLESVLDLGSICFE